MRIVLIRLGGLVTIACGLAWIAGEAISALGVRNITLSHAVDILTEVVLAFGAMVAVVCLHVLQRGHYGWRGTIFSLLAFVGLLLAFNGGVRNYFLTVLNRDGPSLLRFLSLDIYMDEFSLLLASVGIVGLGVVTIVGQVLPWWCGAALIAGSPLFMFIGWVILESLLWMVLPTVPIVPKTVPWMLLAVPWIVVGYAILRARSPLPGRLSRVR